MKLILKNQRSKINYSHYFIHQPYTKLLLPLVLSTMEDTNKGNPLFPSSHELTLIYAISNSYRVYTPNYLNYKYILSQHYEEQEIGIDISPLSFSK